MECEKFSQQLELISPLEEDNALLGEAIEHIKTCPHCQEKSRFHQEFDRLVREQMQAATPPPFLASRIVNRIHSSATPSVREWRLGHLLGGLAVCLLVLMLYNQTRLISGLEKIKANQPLGTPQELVSAHCTLLDIIATISAQRHQNILASRFVVFDDNLTNDNFRRKFSFKIALPTLPPKLRLVGGSKCHSCPYEVAYLLYRTDSDSLSLCVFSASDFGLDNWDGKPTLFKKKGYNVALWKKENLAYAMVSQISESEAKSIIWDSQE
jgi:anti-sigma factor RsiW